MGKETHILVLNEHVIWGEAKIINSLRKSFFGDEVMKCSFCGCDITDDNLKSFGSTERIAALVANPFFVCDRMSCYLGIFSDKKT